MKGKQKATTQTHEHKDALAEIAAALTELTRAGHLEWEVVHDYTCKLRRANWNGYEVTYMYRNGTNYDGLWIKTPGQADLQAYLPGGEGLALEAAIDDVKWPATEQGLIEAARELRALAAEAVEQRHQVFLQGDDQGQVA